MSLATIELGEASGVTPGGDGLPVLDYHNTRRESVVDAAASTATTIEAPGLKSGNRTTTVAGVTAAGTAHWVDIGPDPEAVADGSCPLVLEGQTRFWTCHPGDKVAVLAFS